MLRSRERNFIFVHVQKTGGCSLKHAIRQHVGDARRLLGTHDHAIDGRRRLGREWDDSFTFAVVRNPWDRLVSWYSMIANNDFRKAGKKNRHNQFWHYICEHADSFEAFLTRCTDVVKDRDGRKSIMFNQLDYVSDERGNVIVDFVGRFENLPEDAAHIFSRIGMAEAKMPHRTRSRHAHYCEYYTPALRDLVGERYARDVEHFKYAFEEPVPA